MPKKKPVFVSTNLIKTVIIEAARLMLDCLRRFFPPSPEVSVVLITTSQQIHNYKASSVRSVLQ